MKEVMHILTLNIFVLILRMKGYKTIRAVSERQMKHALSVKHEVYANELKWIFPDECRDWIDKNNKHSIIFIVYHNNIPVGTASLFDPKGANRLYDGYGINENCESYEIGSLAIKKEYRGAQMFVFLSMFYYLYEYSRLNSIKKWLAITSKALYLTIKKFTKSIELIDVSTSRGKDPIGALYHNVAKKLNPSVVCYTIDVDSISPWRIAKDLIKDTLKKQILRISKL